MVPVSRMSADEAPTLIAYVPGTTTQLALGTSHTEKSASSSVKLSVATTPQVF